MTGFKVFNGTKAAFEAKASQYADAIVFISGGTDSKGSCIYAQGMYFGNFAEFLATINYVKGITVGGQSYNAAANGGYVAFGAADPTTIKVNAGQNGVEIGLTAAFVNKVNDTATNLGSKNDAADKDGSAFARIANLAALVGDLTGGSTESIEGQITTVINALRTEIVGTLDTDDSKTLAAINNELDGLDAKVKALEEAGFIKIGDVNAAISNLGGGDNGGEKVKVSVVSKGGQVTEVSVDETALDTALAGKADLSNGKILESQLPDYILGQVLFGGTATYDAGGDDWLITPSANYNDKFNQDTDSLSLRGMNVKTHEGVYFICEDDSLSGAVVEANTGDWIISNGTSWVKIDNTDAVTSVAGLSGNIAATTLAKELAETGDANELALKSEVDAVEVSASGDGTLLTASVSNKRAISVAPTTKLTNAVSKAETAYQKPSTGIAKTDLASAVQTSLGKADTAYQKPSTGIAKSDLASAVQTSLGKADAAAPQATTYTKAEVDAMWEWEVIS